ncbi:MAG: prolyl oligopeptidase family serine peptidase [Bacteroidales bacterium]|nr:prolyl oligopeptidase family serine peptidase [Bacteroidales bacterium]
MRKSTIFYTILLFVLFSFKINKAQNNNFRYPLTFKDTTTDKYFNTKISDPYRWLEDNNYDKTKAWVKAQNNFTFTYLNEIPFRDNIRARLKEILKYERYDIPKKNGEYYYFYKNNGLQNQWVFYRTKELEKNEEVFINPNNFSKDGTISMSKESFSKDGSLLAYQISEKGSDWKKIVVIDTKTKKQIGDTLFNIYDSRISWVGNTGFYYSTFDKPKGEKKLSVSTQYDKLYFHKLNDAQKNDKLIFNGEEHKIRYLKAFVTEDEKFLYIKAAESFRGNGLYIKDLIKKNSIIDTIVKSFDNKNTIIDNNDSELLILTNLNAPNNRLIKVDASNPQPKNWTDLIPETENVLSVTTGGGYLFASRMVDVKSQIIQYDYSGNKIRKIKLPAIGTTVDFKAKKEDTVLFYTFKSFTYPSTIFKFNIKKGTSELFWKPNISFNPEDYVTKQVFYESKDGTKIPMFIVHKKDIELNGKNPTYLYGYGGFNRSLKPLFYLENLIWIENGGIYVHANLRGGGEYGEKWHKAGTKMQKQNVFDDFIAAAEYLIKEKYTSSDYLAISGTSNGGLLIGAVMTQRPDLFKVALPTVGVMDMLKYHKFTSGAAWVSDYGTSEESEEMFKYLYNYSPVHSVKKGIKYPATLIATADHDDRVVPAHSFKFAATLQANTNSNNPVLIRIETNSGHGSGTPISKLIEQVVDRFAFTWYNMGINPFENNK